MSKVNILVLISREQRNRVLSLSAKDPGRVCERAVRLGFEFMHTPLRDFALFTFCLDGSVTHRVDAMHRAELMAPNPAGDEMEVAIDQELHDLAVKHFTAIGLDISDGWQICFWYGLLAYLCRIRSLREMIWGHYPRRGDDPMSQILNDGKTFAGMAYLAATGPKNERCDTCAFYEHGKTIRGKETDGFCHQWASLMGAKKPPTFPSYARACKYWEDRKELQHEADE